MFEKIVKTHPWAIMHLANVNLKNLKRGLSNSRIFDITEFDINQSTRGYIEFYEITCEDHRRVTTLGIFLSIYRRNNTIYNAESKICCNPEDIEPLIAACQKNLPLINFL